MKLAQENDGAELMLMGPPLFDAVDLGYFKSIAKGVKKGVKKGASGIKTGVKATARASKAVTMKVIELHNIPLKLLISFSIRLAKVICATPEPLLRLSATSAGVTYDVVPLFCKAIQTRNMATVRANLPSIIKLALKLAATTAVPGLGPVLAVMKYTPGLSQFAGAPLAASLGSADNTYLGNWSEQKIANEINRMSDDEIADALGLPADAFGATSTSYKAGVAMLLGVSGLAIGLGTYNILRR